MHHRSGAMRIAYTQIQFAIDGNRGFVNAGAETVAVAGGGVEGAPGGIGTTAPANSGHSPKDFHSCPPTGQAWAFDGMVFVFNSAMT